MSPNAELVTRLFNETARGDGRFFWEILADHAVWRCIGTNTWGGSFRGKDSIANDLLRPLGRKLASRATIATRIIDGGNVIVVQARGKNTTHTGVAYDNDYCFVIAFEDGKIVSYEEYCDTELVTQVLGDRMAAWKPAS